MSHPDDLALIASLDGEAVQTGGLTEHLTACPICRQRLAALAQEAAVWRAALRLTPAERALLAAADLPARLVAATQAAHHQAARQANLRHLLYLLGGCLLVALGWMLITPFIDPTLIWASRLVDLPALGLAAVSSLAIPAMLTLITFPVVPAFALTRDLLPVVAVLLLGALVLNRRRAAASPIAS